MAKKRIFVHYYESDDGYARGNPVRFKYTISVKLSRRKGYQDAEIVCMNAQDADGLNRRIGVEGDEDKALEAAKSLIDGHHPKMFGSVVTSGSDTDG